MTQNQNKATPLSHSSTSRVDGFDICSPIIIGQPKPYCMSNWNKNHYLEGHRNVYRFLNFQYMSLNLLVCILVIF